MASRPIICPPANIPGFVFFKDKFVLEEGNTTSKITFFNLANFILPVKAYSRMRISLKSNTSVMISQTDLADDKGFVRWIAIKVKFFTMHLFLSFQESLDQPTEPQKIRSI